MNNLTKNLIAINLGIWTIAFFHFANWYEDILPDLYTVERVLAKEVSQAPKSTLPAVLEEEATKWDLSHTKSVKIEATTETIIKRKIEEAFGEDKDIAVAVAMAESRMNPYAIGDKHLAKPSYGLFQINQIYHNYTEKELLDVDKNIEIAKDISSKGRKWSNWTTYRDGSYLKYLIR